MCGVDSVGQQGSDMKKKYLSTLGITLLFQAHILFAFSFPFLTQKESQQPTAAALPQQDIRQFEKTIALIHQYYIKPVDDKTLLDNAMNGMLTRLDPHSAFLDQEDLKTLDTTVSGEFAGIGLELTTDRGMLRVISPIHDTPAEKAGIKPGDLIIKVDNKLIQEMTVNEAVKHIKGKPGTTVSLTILRKDENKPLVMNIQREVVKLETVKAKMLAPGFGYVRLTLFQGPVAIQLRAAIEKLNAEANGKLKGFVLDLRSNPGGLLDVSAEVADLFLDKNTTNRYHNIIVYTKGRIPNSNLQYHSKSNDMIPGVPMAVLINGGTASAAEIVAGALQDYKRAVILGSRSFGKGSVQTIIPLDKEGALKLTTALYFTPSGREIQARGIEPDVIVPELAVDEKQITGLLDFDEANYDRHIENHDNSITQSKTQSLQQKSEQKKQLELAKSDYQLYEALMMLRGMHAVR